MTVVIPTYNWSEVLPYSISTVLDQTFTDFELVVAGDCCTDDSEAVVAAIDDPRVSWLNLPVNSRHQSGPNNEAIRRSDSDLIAYLGHDDLWLPHHLGVLVDALAGTAGISHGSTLMVDPTQPARAYPRGDWTYWHAEWLPPTSVLHSRSLIDTVGGWRPPSETGTDGSESELWSRMSRTAGRPPVWVRDVTSVKLPASLRADVYLTRPHHEQQIWLDRIHQGESWRHLVDEPWGDIGMRWHHSTSPALRWTAHNLGRQAWRRWLHLPNRIPRETAADRWRSLRRHKGLEQGAASPSGRAADR